MSNIFSLDTNIKKINDINPRKEFYKNYFYFGVCKTAAITSLVAYTALAIIATVLVGIYAPIYLPIVIPTVVIFADLIYKKIFTIINNRAKMHYTIAKHNKGVAEELDKLTNKADVTQAKINYLEKRINKCEQQKNKYSELVELAVADPKQRPIFLMALNKYGRWEDKSIQIKLNLAYCQVLKINSKYNFPCMAPINFTTRASIEKFLKTVPVVAFQNGKGLCISQLEQLKAEDIAKIMLEPSAPVTPPKNSSP